MLPLRLEAEFKKPSTKLVSWSLAPDFQSVFVFTKEVRVLPNKTRLVVAILSLPRLEEIFMGVVPTHVDLAVAQIIIRRTYLQIRTPSTILRFFWKTNKVTYRPSPKSTRRNKHLRYLLNKHTPPWWLMVSVLHEGQYVEMRRQVYVIGNSFWSNQPPRNNIRVRDSNGTERPVRIWEASVPGHHRVQAAELCGPNSKYVLTDIRDEFYPDDTHVLRVYSTVPHVPLLTLLEGLKQNNKSNTNTFLHHDMFDPHLLYLLDSFNPITFGEADVLVEIKDTIQMS